MPNLDWYRARDGVQLAYRKYSATTTRKGSVILIHRSSASSNSMHPMASAFAHAGYDAYALDIRGHGSSGVKGVISYVGQLEDDLEDFTNAVTLSTPRTLVGFSSGGGFLLRVAGSARQSLFDSYLLLSPYVHYAAPTARPDSGGWVNIGVPRTIAISMLNRVGIHLFNHLSVTEFALDENARAFLTPWYSWALAANFSPHSDYRGNRRRSLRRRPVRGNVS